MLPERTWPFSVRPGSFETVASYLRRLRSANLITDATWGAWVKPTVRATGLGRNDALPLIAEAVGDLSTGHFARDGAALPRHADGETCVNCVTGLDNRFGCARCTPGERVEQDAHDGPRVCRRHLMWVGPGIAPEDQFRVGVEALRADRMYRRLRRQGALDAHRLAEVLACVDDWADAEGAPLDAAQRFTLAVRIGQQVFRPRSLDAYADRGVEAQERYATLSLVVIDIANTEACVVLVDAIWLLIRALGHQDQDNPHAFVCTPKEGNVDERDELEQLRTCRLPRAEHLHATQYVSSSKPGTRRDRVRHEFQLNDYVCARGHLFSSRLRMLRASKESGGCGYCANRKPLAGFNTLADTHKHLISEWDWDKNGELRPDGVIAGSADKVHWRCSARHSFEQSLNNRSSKGVGCPVCSNKAVDAAVNAFSVTHSDVASAWHATLNGDRTPDDYVAGSEQVAWWSCPSHGEYKMLISRRTSGGSCTYCSRQKVHRTSSLAVTDPAVAARWHESLNGDLTPYDVLSGSGEKAWFVCAEGHDYEAPIHGQTIGKGCNVCRGKVVNAQNSLRTMFPALADEVHPTRNGSWNADNVTGKSGRTLIWLCEEGHDWPAIVSVRARQGTGCPFCSNTRVWSGWNDLATTRPDWLTEWDWEENGDTHPTDVTAGTGTKLYWKCTYSHTWEARGSDRRKGSGCPTCANKRLLVGWNDMGTTRPDLVTEWDWDANGTLTPQDIVAGTHVRIHWKCALDHAWVTTGTSRAHRGSGCPACHALTQPNSISPIHSEPPE
ncbi:zinc-ribbon domain-containing protein [Microbacterium sp. ISL-59]|uniref:zinc-ribbon domain-containing protein n=1 Tax=Microbacterium sp. ISL-59 TaxID=2819159 RepID=UPI001BEC289A|nr:zinc-ribbon domain-containing protein [Microbacterium sp. ISL-59]MBT2496200.1 zinc-ribbon domain-containing protein [Microbacterium sp. ISL-59]